MRAVDLIVKKRDGNELTSQEIRFFVKGLLSGEVADYQASAMCMAIYFRGLTYAETRELTREMMCSGDTVDLEAVRGFKVDKHSTGGVGDKTTLVVAPLVAGLGVPVAKMSGRALGHTGGTIDKLESIPGFDPVMSRDRFIDSVNRIGIAVIGQSQELAPADKVLYALRDVTGTVESIPLIAGSILSKKLAAGADGIMLDVKCGSGAFMKELNEARLLAETMVRIGNDLGRRMDAMITAMDQPLGRAVGNSVEVCEAISTLRNEGPSDLSGLCVQLGARMLLMSGVAGTLSECMLLAERALASGAALRKFQEFVENQGGDPSICETLAIMPRAAHEEVMVSERAGTVCRCDAFLVGHAAMLLGAGRLRKDDPIDHSAGVVLYKKIGESVEVGEPIAKMLTSSPRLLADARPVLESAFAVADEPVPVPSVVLDPLRIFCSSQE